MDGLVECLASSVAYHIALHCTGRSNVRERVRCRFCTKGIEGTLTGGKSAVSEADHSNLMSRISTIGLIPSLPICIHGAYRDKCAFVFTVCVSVLLF